MTRKEELLKELEVIEHKEISKRLKEAKKAALLLEDKESLVEAKSARNIMYGDFVIKLLVAVGVSLAFLHIVYTGNADAMTHSGGQNDGNFQLLSVVGPLFGMVLQYYFGAKKKSSNGE